MINVEPSEIEKCILESLSHKSMAVLNLLNNVFSISSIHLFITQTFFDEKTINPDIAERIFGDLYIVLKASDTIRLEDVDDLDLSMTKPMKKEILYLVQREAV